MTHAEFLVVAGVLSLNVTVNAVLLNKLRGDVSGLRKYFSAYREHLD